MYLGLIFMYPSSSTAVFGKYVVVGWNLDIAFITKPALMRLPLERTTSDGESVSVFSIVSTTRTPKIVSTPDSWTKDSAVSLNSSETSSDDKTLGREWIKVTLTSGRTILSSAAISMPTAPETRHQHTAMTRTINILRIQELKRKITYPRQPQ